MSQQVAVKLDPHQEDRDKYAWEAVTTTVVRYHEDGSDDVGLNTKLGERWSTILKCLRGHYPKNSRFNISNMCADLTVGIFYAECARCTPTITAWKEKISSMAKLSEIFDVLQAACSKVTKQEFSGSSPLGEKYEEILKIAQEKLGFSDKVIEDTTKSAQLKDVAHAIFEDLK